MVVILFPSDLNGRPPYVSTCDTAIQQLWEWQARVETRQPASAGAVTLAYELDFFRDASPFSGSIYVARLVDQCERGGKRAMTDEDHAQLERIVLEHPTEYRPWR
jgi:hypothetical protein